MPFDFDYTRVLDFSKAHLRGNLAVGLISDKDVQIQHEVPLGAGEQSIDWLQENRQTLRDVAIDHQKLDGVWRSVDIKSQQSTSNKEAVLIIQTFRYGFIESLTSETGIDFSEARLVRGNEWHEGSVNGEFVAGDTAATSTNPQKYFLVEWHGVDPKKAETIRQAVRNVSPNNITLEINGEAYGEGFYVLDAVSEIPESWNDTDKSAKITALFAKPRFNLQAWEKYNTPEEAKVYYLFDVPVYIAQSLINIYNKRTGATGTASAPDQRGLVNITIRDKSDEKDDGTYVSETNCQSVSLTTYHYGLDAPKNVPDNEMGITYRGRFDLRDGVYSGYIVKTIRQTQHILPFRSLNTHGKYETVERYAGAYVDGSNYTSVALTFVGATVSSHPTAITLPDNSLELGKTWQVQKRENEDCTEDLTFVNSTEKSVADVEYDSQDSNSAHTSTTEKMNRESASVVLEAGSNEVLRANVRYNKDTGLLDVSEDVTSSKPTDGQDVEESAAATRTVTKTIMTDTKPSDPAQEDGKVKATQWEETEFEGRYRATESVVEAKDQESTGGVERADQSSVVVRHTQAVEEVEVELIEGRIVNVDNRKTEFGRVATSKETVTPKDQTGESTEIRADRTSATATHTQAYAPADDSPEVGKIVQAQSAPTEFGKNKTAKTVVSPINQVNTSKAESHSESVDQEVNTQADAELDDPVETLGEIVDVSNSGTEFPDKVQTSHRRRIAKDQEATDDAKDLYVHRSTEKHTQTNEPISGAFVRGTIERIESVPTDFGKFRTAIEALEAQAVTGTTKETTVDYFSKQLQSKDRNQLEAGTDITALDGSTIKISKWTRNDFDLYDNDSVSVEPIARSSGWLNVTNRWGIGKEIVFRNQPVSWISGTLLPEFDNNYTNDFRFTMNQHGLYDGGASRTAYQGSGETDMIIWSPLTGSLRKPEFRQQKDSTGKMVAQVRYHNYTVKTKVEATMAGAQGVERDFQLETPAPIKTGITSGTLKYGAKYYMARATFYKSTTAWATVDPAA